MKQWLAVAVLILGVGLAQKTIKLDYAYYNPVSLVLKEKGWLEQEFAKDGTRVEWVLSAGSNRANEFLASGSVQFASTAGSAALLARSNGLPLRTVFIYTQPEWAALVVGKDSPVKTVADLRGKSIAVTRGTDPYFFLLQALRTAGLSQKDVNLVYLQHPDGQQALLTGRVDAWSGLDPYIADAEVKAGARIIYRNPLFNSFGFLNVLESFAAENPETVQRVLRVYARARDYAAKNLEETAAILAKAASLDVAVARQVITQRTRFVNPSPGGTQRVVLDRITQVIVAERLAAPGANVAQAAATILEPKYLGQALASR